MKKKSGKFAEGNSSNIRDNILKVRRQLQTCQRLLKVIFSDEFGQNLNLVIPTQYDGRSLIKSG